MKTYKNWYIILVDKINNSAIYIGVWALVLKFFKNFEVSYSMFV